MKKSSSWIEQRRKDHYFKLAKEKGYRSRAAFKLSQIIKSYRFVRIGDQVIDLGAAPGGWTQVLIETVGTEGYVFAVDIQPIEPLDSSQTDFIELDITSNSAIEYLKKKLPEYVDVVVSDISPDVSGIWDLDHFRQIHLAKISLQIAKRFLKFGGNFLIKVFQGNELEIFIKDFKKNFRQTRIIKPKATRTSSSELYVLGLGFKKKKFDLN
ncbi:RlmE family RNA methyltransferase [[Eubacterium] cellulosolvens]